MSKKDKKIELQLSDSKVTINNAKVDGYALQTGKKQLVKLLSWRTVLQSLKTAKLKPFSKI